jgi:hypothetical protein
LLRSLRRGAHYLADPLPRQPDSPRLSNRFNEMPLGPRACNYGTLQLVFLERYLRRLIGIEGFEPLRKFVGVIENLLD